MNLQKIKSVTKVSFRRSVILSFLALFIFSAFIEIFPFQKVFAQGESYAVYVGQSTSELKAVADTWNNKDDSYDDAGWKRMRVMASGGGLWGEGQTLNFDTKVTKEIACQGTITGLSPDQCESREPIFTKTYYCSIPSHQLGFRRPSDNQEYYEIVYGIALTGNGESGDSFVAKKDYHAWAGIARVKKFKLTDAGYTRSQLVYDITDGNRQPDDLPNGSKGNREGNDDKFGIDNSDGACRPSGSAIGEITIPNYNKLSDAQKAKFTDPTVAGTNADGENIDNANDVNCDGGGALGWILCPVFELGANIAHDTFTKILQPMMENVPVSTSSGDPTYRAWQGFRIIGNVILIGALLGVVFYQAKGGE